MRYRRRALGRMRVAASTRRTVINLGGRQKRRRARQHEAATADANPPCTHVASSQLAVHDLDDVAYRKLLVVPSCEQDRLPRRHSPKCRSPCVVPLRVVHEFGKCKKAARSAGCGRGVPLSGAVSGVSRKTLFLLKSKGGPTPLWYSHVGRHRLLRFIRSQSATHLVVGARDQAHHTYSVCTHSG